ncbi:Phenylcoumaran benzylic ether reductase TP77 [Hyphodiscus hymeniophilus]|uniref:Phenylcoumaran benzylic ether reductase TP77 n=1 Tax=Hyphodiscus hymeniophilus TaxID=353542 RepID=A0A9P6VJE2_9HELO|nr:Phenylcoumaran benzylic ether reductase TP77 [Hyphodiscus hymeniophilus]
MAVIRPRSIVVVATPTAPLLPDLLHALFHTPGLEVTVLTRETTIKVPIPHAHTHAGNGLQNSGNPPTTSWIAHVKTSFAEPELTSLLEGKETLICCLTGIDIHLSPDLIAAAQRAGVKRFLPAEFGLDTGKEEIRSLLPPYQTRFEIQRRLKSSGMRWTAVYSGLMLEEALKENGILGIDVLWASVVVFPHDEKVRVALSSYRDVANAIVDVVVGNGEAHTEVYTAGFLKTLEEVVTAVEKTLDRVVDRYEGTFEGARKEAAERMKLGYFDGGVALMGRVAAWDERVDAWRYLRSESVVERSAGDWEEEVGRVVKGVREGQIKGDGCGC